MTPAFRRAIAALSLVLLTACAPSAREADTQEPGPLSRDAVLMGTRVRLATYSSTREAGLGTLDAALAILEDTERDLSTWLDDSSVSHLNRTPVGTPWIAAGRMCGLFEDLSALVAMTDGAFDPAIGRLTDAWDIHGEGRLPDPGMLDAALERSGWSGLAVEPRTCTVVREADVTIDVGAFGKGEALDRVVMAGLTFPWLIDLGGQISAAGRPPRTSGWPVALAHPWDRNREALALEIPPGSLATSGGSERDLRVDGERVGHVLDPRTGRPAPFAGSVSVWHISGLYADALSTALYVLGPDDGLAWAAERDLAAVYLIPDGDDLRVKATPAFEPFIVAR